MMKKLTYTLCVFILITILASCSSNKSQLSNVGNGIKEITSFKAKKGDKYSIDYSFMLSKGWVDFYIYNEDSLEYIFTSSIKDKAKYKGSFDIPKTGKYIVEYEAYKSSGKYNFKLYDKSISIDKDIKKMKEMVLSKTKNHNFEIERWNDKNNIYYNVSLQTDYEGISLCTWEGVKNEDSVIIAGNEDREDDIIVLPTSINVWNDIKTIIHFSVPKEKTVGGIVLYYQPIDENGEVINTECIRDRILFHE